MPDCYNDADVFTAVDKNQQGNGSPGVEGGRYRGSWEAAKNDVGERVAVEKAAKVESVFRAAYSDTSPGIGTTVKERSALNGLSGRLLDLGKAAYNGLDERISQWLDAVHGASGTTVNDVSKIFDITTRARPTF